MRSIDQLRARFGWGPESDENPIMEPLTATAVSTLRLPWLSRFNPHTLSQYVRAYPGYSLWVPASGEYAVAEPWRRRADIANIIEISARKGKAALVRQHLAELHALGNRLVLLSDEIWRDQTRFYMDLGFEKLQTIVFYERTLAPDIIRSFQGSGLPPLTYTAIGLEQIDTLLEVDHSSFPWLWWNSREEFELYMQVPDVTVILALHEGEPVGYASFTVYQGWAHLDRLAVVEAAQGRKYGAAQLVYVMGLMLEAGARTVALSTQETNVKSHRLYEGFGFRQTHETMSFFGIKLDPSVVIA